MENGEEEVEFALCKRHERERAARHVRASKVAFNVETLRNVSPVYTAVANLWIRAAVNNVKYICLRAHILLLLYFLKSRTREKYIQLVSLFWRS